MITREQFIIQIVDAVKVLAPKYGIKVVSPIVAQACLESNYGTSDKVRYHNYFGLKYRKNRVRCNSGFFTADGSEQNMDGTYTPIETDWYAFTDLYSGVEGYFQFINVENYANLKGVTDPYKYIELIKKDNYATDLFYVKKLQNVIESNNLIKYDCYREENGMLYTNSSLIDCTVLSPNHSGLRKHKIDRISPHCVVGQLSAEAIGACFPKGRGASANYGIGYDGRQCLIVEEKNRSWCSSNEDNDQRAVTIEVASDKTAPYAFTEEAYAGLLELCIDICKRNGLNKVLWFNDKNKSLNYEPKDGECVLTVHRWFKNKSCPGDWMYARMSKLASDINVALLKDGGSVDVSIKVPNGGNMLYRVQCGAYKNKNNAKNMLVKIKSAGIDAFITQADGLYKVQVGAYGIKSNAEKQLDKMKKLGFDCFITTVSRDREAFIPRKSAEDIAKEIYTGVCSDSRWPIWSTGSTGKERLITAGYNVEDVKKAYKQRYGIDLEIH